MVPSIQKSLKQISISYSHSKQNNIKTITSLGGCVVHEVAKRCSDASYAWQKHYWRRPTIALMSAPVERSKYKLDKIPTEFINYFVNDISKRHLNELSVVAHGGVVLFDVTRDLFTGVLDLGDGCYIMNPVDGVGIIDGLTAETMDLDMIYSILGFKPSSIDYVKQPELFFDLWKIHFQKLLWFLEAKFQHVVLLEIYFTHESVFGGSQPNFVKIADKANKMLADMYAFARSQGVEIVGLERSAYVTGNFVPWGGPSLTHFVEETLVRLADRVMARIDPSLPLSEGFVRQAYKRAEAYEQTMTWLNRCKVDLEAQKEKISELEQAVELEKSQSQLAIVDSEYQIQALKTELEAAIALERVVEDMRVSVRGKDQQIEAISGLLEFYKGKIDSLAYQSEDLMIQVADLESKLIDAESLNEATQARALEAEARALEMEARANEAERLAVELERQSIVAMGTSIETNLRVEMGEARALEAETRALEAEARADEAERHALELERQSMVVMGVSLEANLRVEMGEARALEAESREADMAVRLAEAERRVAELEGFALGVEQRVLMSESNRGPRWAQKLKSLVDVTK